MTLSESRVACEEPDGLAIDVDVEPLRHALEHETGESNHCFVAIALRLELGATSRQDEEEPDRRHAMLMDI